MSLFRMLLALRTGDTLELSPGTLPFDAPGGTQGLTVRANRKWTLDVEYADGNDDNDNT